MNLMYGLLTDLRDAYSMAGWEGSKAALDYINPVICTLLSPDPLDQFEVQGSLSNASPFLNKGGFIPLPNHAEVSSIPSLE